MNLHVHRSIDWQADLARTIFTAAMICLVLCEANRLGAQEGQPPEPQPEFTAAQIDELIAQLGDDDYFVRQRAQDKLARIGFEAFDALTQAENHDDVEIAARARYLVRLIRVEWSTERDTEEVKALVANYGTMAERERLQIVRQLSQLQKDEGLGALCRMVRFERSAAVSKMAALAVITRTDPAIDWQRRSTIIRRAAGESLRPGAVWLRTYLQAHDDAAAALPSWAELIADEEKVADESPSESRPEIISGLLRYQVKLLRELGRRDEAIAAMLKIIEREQGETETLSELVAWLAEQQAWTMVDEVYARFADRFAQDPLLLYALAQARLAQGDTAQADLEVQRALALNPANHVQHWVAAVNLIGRGLPNWSEGELRKVVEIGPANNRYTLDARFRLAESFHDRGDESDASAMLEQAAENMESNVKDGNEEENAGRDLTAIRARLHFFRACKHELEGDGAAQLKELEAGLEHDPLDADVLISLYRHPNASPELKERTRTLIREAVDEFRRQAQTEPENPMPYNQLAWLVSNTEGDQAEALAFSQKSLELRPNTAGYLDTLGRCYFAQGDLENAVKYQSRAVELDPHSGLMQKQLRFFQDALEKK